MLKPVKDLIDLLDYSLKEGACRCMRCNSGENQETYKTPHNFNIDGVTYRRQFAKSGKDDLLAKMKTALKSCYKDEEIDLTTPFDGTKIEQIIGEKKYKLFTLLGKANGLIKNITDNQISENDI